MREDERAKALEYKHPGMEIYGRAPQRYVPEAGTTHLGGGAMGGGGARARCDLKESGRRSGFLFCRAF